MPPLNLAPWEIPEGLSDSPEGPAHATHIIPWINGPCPVLFRYVQVSPHKGVVFARSAESQDAGNWLVCHTNSPSLVVKRDANYWSPSQFEPAKYIKDLVRLMHADNSPIDFMRLVVTQIEGKSNCALLSSPQPCQWMQWEPLQPKAAFQIPFLAESIQESSQVRESLNRELANPNSDASFALRWASLTPNEKSQLLLSGQEQIAEIQQLMRWTLQSQPHLWQTTSAWEWQLLASPHLAHLSSTSSSTTYRPYQAESDFAVLYAVASCLIESYIAPLIAPLLQRYTCVRDYPSYIPASDYNWGPQEESWACISIDGPPTTHERLEATLCLRHWLQTYTSPEEFGELEKFLP